MLDALSINLEPFSNRSPDRYRCPHLTNGLHFRATHLGLLLEITARKKMKIFLMMKILKKFKQGTL
jgi:hypothetical protein